MDQLANAIDASGENPRCKTASKPHSTPLTLKWLEENYEIAEGVCIPRNALYMHYLDFCEKNDTQPVNAASFGKIIRQQFPQITTRRLGTRGQSKYHYYGIGVKESSAYYDVMYSAKNGHGTGYGKKDNYRQIVTYSPKSKLGTLLPEFPEVKDLKLPPNIPEDKVLTFLMMYRTHCQRILDTVIRANFDEIQSFLLHFWQGMPQHMVPVLCSHTIVTLVGVCDSILYKAIANVLMPTVLQALPDSLTQVIRKFAKQFDDWLKVALDSLPENLRKVKFDLARRFSQVLRRQTSLNHLCQAARTVTQNPDITSQMLEDWLNIDLNSIVKQTLYTMDHYSERDHQIIANLCQEFEKLLEEQAPIEYYLEWLDTMVDRCIVQPSAKKCGVLRRVARQFLLMWSCFGTRVIRDMTLQSSPSFGSFHLLHLMFDDYVLYLIENLHSQERAGEFLRNVRGEQGNIDFCDILPSSVSYSEGIPSPAGHMTPPTSTQRPLERCSVITNGKDIVSQVTDFVCNQEDLSVGGTQGSSPDDSPRSVSIKTFQQADSSRSPSNVSIPSTSLPGTPVNVSGSPYQQCHQPYQMQYGQNMATQHTSPIDAQGQHAMYSYDVTSSQYSRHYVTAEHGSKDTAINGNRQGTMGAEWQDSGRYNPMLPEGILRINDNLNFSPYSAVRTKAYEYSGYGGYGENCARAMVSVQDPTSHGYYGYGHVPEYAQDGGRSDCSSSKRKYEQEGMNRNYKRYNREQYGYHQPNNDYV